MEENKEVFIPEPLSDALFDDKITPKQRKFILLLVHSEGLKTATQCAIEAGYKNKKSLLREIASKLQNPEQISIWLQKQLIQNVRANVDRYKMQSGKIISYIGTH